MQKIIPLFSNNLITQKQKDFDKEVSLMSNKEHLTKIK